MALAQHRGVSVLGEEDRELTLAHGVEALRYIGKELYVLRLVELRFGLDAILGLTPAEGLGRAATSCVSMKSNTALNRGWSDT